MAAKVRLNKAKILTLAYTSPKTHRYVYSRFKVWRRLAQAHFQSVQIKTNEHLTSETTPPKYVRSFKFRRGANNWFFENVDPGAMWVEFGAHAGGKTKVLGYSPMRTAIHQMTED